MRKNIRIVTTALYEKEGLFNYTILFIPDGTNESYVVPILDKEKIGYSLIENRPDLEMKILDNLHKLVFNLSKSTIEHAGGFYNDFICISLYFIESDINKYYNIQHVIKINGQNQYLYGKTPKKYKGNFKNIYTNRLKESLHNSINNHLKVLKHMIIVSRNIENPNIHKTSSIIQIPNNPIQIIYKYIQSHKASSIPRKITFINKPTIQQ